MCVVLPVCAKVFDPYFEFDEIVANVVVFVMGGVVSVVDEVFVDIISGFNDVVGVSGMYTIQLRKKPSVIIHAIRHKRYGNNTSSN